MDLSFSVEESWTKIQQPKRSWFATLSLSNRSTYQSIIVIQNFIWTTWKSSFWLLNHHLALLSLMVQELCMLLYKVMQRKYSINLQSSCLRNITKEVSHQFVLHVWENKNVITICVKFVRWQFRLLLLITNVMWRVLYLQVALISRTIWIRQICSIPDSRPKLLILWMFLMDFKMDLIRL